MPWEVNKHKMLATFDISSMYTNIDNNHGQDSIHFWLEKYPENKAKNIPNDFILEALQSVLEYNTFTFKRKTFKQSRSTAMGTECAPAYATLVMVFLESKLYDKCQENFGIEARTKFQNEWMRYLDDCFIYWDTRLGPIRELHNILNKLRENIKCTVETRYKRMTFLDIQMIIQGDTIITDIYNTPTDTQNYVPFKSAHPNHTVRNIPYNIARRLCTIVDDKTTLNTRLKEFTENLKDLGHLNQMVESSIKEPREIPQEQLRETKENSQEREVLPYVSTNNPKHPTFYPIITH